MNRYFVLAMSLGLTAVALFAIGCARQPQATPVPTPTENVEVVVVTATTQATIAPTETGEPTITPLATFTPLGLNSPTATPIALATDTRVKSPATANTPRAVKSATTAPPAARPTAISSQNKFPAPTAISPTTGDSRRDGDDLKFYFSSVGLLAANDCYLLYVQMVNPNASTPPAGDYFLDTAHCGDQTPLDRTLTYTLFRPKYTNVPNYGTIEALAQGPAGADLLKVQWYVRVVLDNGLGPDGVHHNTVPLSPNSAMLEFDFRP